VAPLRRAAQAPLSTTGQGTAPRPATTRIAPEAHRPARDGRRLTPKTIRDLLLVALTASSGVIDAISFLALGKVFTAFMTGNVVFAALGLVGAFGPSGPDPVRVIAALVAFAAGVFIATRVVTDEGSRGMWPRGATIALGAAAVAQIGFEAGWLAAGGHPSNALGTVLLAVAAVAMGLQSGAVLSMGVAGVFTTAATATLVFLMRDEAERPASAAEPERLAGVLVALFAGAAAGGLLLVHARTLAPALPPLLTLSVIVVAARVFGRAPAGAGDQPPR
jgi:uncharacterized membrane protein YoaK (UPF0700 family)